MGTQGDPVSHSDIGPVDIGTLLEARAKGQRLDATRHLLAAELEHIGRRTPSPSYRPPRPDETESLSGLALSGGGIRSATICLGVMQALAKHHLLERFDYLSTVSGGGFIGGALSWWLSDQSRLRRGRGGLARLAAGLFKHESTEQRAAAGDGAPHAIPLGLGPEDFPFGTQDPDPKRGASDEADRFATDGRFNLLRYLRQNGNYLTPGDGRNRISAAVTVLRGVLLTLLSWMLIFVSLMTGLMAGSRALMESSRFGNYLAHFPRLYERILSGYFDVDTSAEAVASTIGDAPTALRALYEREVVFAFELAVWGVIALLAAFLIAIVLYALFTYVPSGSTGERYRARRGFERWSGVAAQLTLLLVFMGSIPVTAYALSAAAEETGSASLVLGLLSGAFSYAKSGGNGGPFRTALLATIGSGLLLYGMLMTSYWIAAELTFLESDAVTLGLLAIAFVFGYFVNLNYLSIHRFYRDRLMEAYMPDAASLVSKHRAPALGANKTTLHALNPDSPRGPYHLINANVILVRSSDRTRQMRGGDNFILSPLYCGSSATGWVPTPRFASGSMTLATSVAISGAAAQPNTGVGGVGLARNPMLSVMLNLLNVSLGYRVMNPRTHRTGTPDRFWPGLVETFPWLSVFRVFGKAYERHARYLHLSDGGHFDNLGLYELIRRRLKLIVLCDCGQDGNFEFQDFTNAIGRIEADFGARITFDDRSRDLESIRFCLDDAQCPPERRFAESACAIGTIHYPALEGEPKGLAGTLVYVKSTLIKDLSQNIMGYRATHKAFPHDPTFDQFFDEAQFDAYRRLGYALARETIRESGLASKFDELQRKP